jgi:murein DD-endopeptidase MepM/ murein hydrolase activator NlpD
VRDYVAFCTSVGKPTDSLYLLPYKGKTLTVQGNNGLISHNNNNNRFAWDFETVAASDNNIYAARAGRVIEVQDGFSGNCAGCPNNRIRLLHQDGTESHYLHGATGGSNVNVGQIVWRGFELGLSGNVGNSIGQHIHFSAHAANNGISIPSSFDDQSEPCVIPQGPFDTKESTLTIGQDITYKYRSSPLNFPSKR